MGIPLMISISAEICAFVLRNLHRFSLLFLNSIVEGVLANDLDNPVHVVHQVSIGGVQWYGVISTDSTVHDIHAMDRRLKI